MKAADFGLKGNAVLCREKEINLINRLMDARKNIVIYGDEGVGKTAIIKEIITAKKLKTLYSGKSSTLKELLANLVISGSENRNIKSENILGLKKMFYRIIDKRKIDYIVIDHAGAVDQKCYYFASYLTDMNLSIVVLCRGLVKKDIGYLRFLIYNFAKVWMPDYSKSTADIITDHYIEAFGIKVSDSAMFKRDIFRFSKGNPRIIRALCRLARNDKYRVQERFNVRRMNFDRRFKNIFVHVSLIK